jgi:hypothetical protein
MAPPASQSPLASPGGCAAGDPLLGPFLGAPGADAAREALGSLIEARVSPLARAVIRGQLGDAGQVEDGLDRDDVHAGVLLRISEQLWSVRAGLVPAIEDLAAYVAAAAHNACHAFFRRRFPERSRLRSKLRYVLTRDPALSLWHGAGGQWLCGLATWRGQQASDTAAQRLRELRGRLVAFAPGDRERLAFPELVRSLLRRAGGACALQDVLAILEDVLGLAGAPRAAGPLEDAHGRAEAADPRPSAPEELERRDFLERLWSEIRLLPLRQRRALLLNLRDPEGHGMVGLFPLTGVASRAELAAALEMPEARLAALWDDLPCDDHWIARELGVTRRQVINLRKCARERLARRTRGE